MEQVECLFSGSAWFKERLDGPDGHLWKRARRMFLFNHHLSSALNLFKFDYRAIETISRPEGTVLRCARSTDLDPNEEREHVSGQSWADDAKNSVRTLLDRIVTSWEPKYMKLSRINVNKLHPTLTPVPLQFVRSTYVTTNRNAVGNDVEQALKIYQECLVPLHYHELWSEVVSDFRNVDTKLEKRETIVNIELFYDKMTLDEEEESALIFGTNRVIYEDSYKPLSKKLGLFDLVLIKMYNVDYFGMIVHVEQRKVKVNRENENSRRNSTTNNNQNVLEFDLHTTVGIYVSRACSDVIQQLLNQTKDKNVPVPVFKLSNITSSRRMISAIHNLHEWPHHSSLLKPTIDDPYFKLPEDYDPSNVIPTNGFNEAQSKTIAIAECMYDDLLERMHIVHGPPGTGKSRTIAGIVVKLLSKLPESGRKQKILLCAPSNNACDELSRRILDEFDKQGLSFRRDTLVRIGCQPPDDYRLCDHFLDFMILQDIVNVLKDGNKPSDNIAKTTESRIMRHAKIVVSTLNYCGSTRMQPLKSSTAFVIIDEASQSLEADFLLPLRFKCEKLMLVGDPLQLPPCVLSDAGKNYGLSQSLYARIYFRFKDHPNSPISMLDTQYRMHPDICAFPSEHFYSDRLFTDGSVARRMRYFTLKSLHLYDITDSPHRYDDASSSYNEGEASIIRDFCRKLIAHLAQQSTRIYSANEDDESEDDDDDSSTTSSSDSTHDSDDDSDHEASKEMHYLEPLAIDDPRSIDVQKRIAVITPYKAQVRLLRSYLPPYVEIMTADSSQGKEKDIVLLSCVRSGDNIGFLDDMNRLNVMLTRSKNALYVFGNLTQLADQHDGWRAFVNYARGNRIFRNVNTIGFDLPYRF